MIPKHFFCLITVVISTVLVISYPAAAQKVPLVEHPRPDFYRATYQNLNGIWDFRADTADVGLKQHWERGDVAFNDKILVPFSWGSELSGIHNESVLIAWYKRSITVNKELSDTDQDIYLVIGASDYITTVWVNGIKAGTNTGGYTPFDFNISPHLKDGENEIIIRVFDGDTGYGRPAGKQGWYGNARGIWQTVYLEARPKVFIKHIHFLPDIDKSKVLVKVKLSEKTKKETAFSVKGKSNTINLDEIIPRGKQEYSFELTIDEPHLWNLDDPYLYNVEARGGEDMVNTYFGMRKISYARVSDKDYYYITLNNEPIYIKIPLDQSYHEQGHYTFPSDKFMKDEVLRAKKLGLNGLRIHIKTEIPRKLYWADKLGMLIMADIPNCSGDPDAKQRKSWEQVAEAQLERDFNHPSIFSWVLFNETWGLFTHSEQGREYLPATQDWVASWYHRFKEMDPTRLIEDNSPTHGDHVVTDLNTWHSYLPARLWEEKSRTVAKNTFVGSSFNYIGDNTQTGVPMLNSECGAVWGYAGRSGDIDITWEYHLMINAFRRYPKISGFVFTELHDVSNEWNGYYRYNRDEKEFGLDDLCPEMTINDFHTDYYVIPGNDFYKEYNKGEEVTVPVEISLVANHTEGDGLTIEYRVYGYDYKGEIISTKEWEILNARVESFASIKQEPISFKIPDGMRIGALNTVLKNAEGKVLSRNFIPFRVKDDRYPGYIQPVSAVSYYNSEWSGKQMNPMEGKKTWGMGEGFYEYKFYPPRGNAKTAVFRCEMAARYDQPKYLTHDELVDRGYEIPRNLNNINGYNSNSYPQTDMTKTPSKVRIYVNGELVKTTTLEDDPADHRGMLSWMVQRDGRNPELEKGDWNPWILDEAGSYGYLIEVDISEELLLKSKEERNFTIRIEADNGLSIYGSESGRYPFDPHVEFYSK